MSFPARKLQSETIVEERIARLESNVEHIQSDVAEIKVDQRRLESKMEAKFDAVDKKFDSVNRRFDALNDRLTAFEHSVRESLAAINIGRALDKVWAMLALATLLGAMARGFKWV